MGLKSFMGLEPITPVVSQKNPRTISTVSSGPTQDLANLGPVAFHNDIGYVPAKSWSGVPGVGVSNLAFVPDTLLSAPQYIAGAGELVPANSFAPTHPPLQVVDQPVLLSGLGGSVAGSLTLYPLLEVGLGDGN